MLAVAAFTLAWIAFRIHIVGDYYTESDFYGGYVDGARRIQGGHLDASRYAVAGPCFDASIALIGFFVRDLFVAAKIVATASAAATLTLWWLILRRRAGAAAALWGAALLAANPVFLRYGYSVTTDMLAVALQSAALYCMLASDGRWAPFCAGVFTALAVLTRYNAAYLVPAAAIAYLWLAPALATSRPRALGIYLAGFIAIALPWVVFSIAAGYVPGAVLFHRFGSFFAVNDFSRNVQDMFASEVDSLARAGAAAHPAGHDPAGLVFGALRALPAHLVSDARVLLGVPVAIACAIGFALVMAGRTARPLLPVWAAGGLLFATLAPIFYSDRYSLPLLPVYLSAAAAGIAGPALAWPIPRLRVPIKWLIALVPLGLSIQSSIAYQKGVFANCPTEVVTVGRLLERLASPGERVMSRKAHIGYYARLENVPFPRVRSLAELAAYAHGRGVNYLYYSWYEERLRPEFGYLMDTTAVVPGLTRIAETDRMPSELFRVGPAFGSDPDWMGDAGLRHVHYARGVVRVTPDSIAALFHLVLAADAVDREDAPAVLTHAEAAIRGRPRDPAGWLFRGDAFRAMGRRGEAIRSYETALEIVPSNTNVRIAIGSMQLEMGDSAAAANTWRAVLPEAIDPADLQAMAQLFASRGDREATAAAIAALRRVTAAQP